MRTDDNRRTLSCEVGEMLSARLSSSHCLVAYSTMFLLICLKRGMWQLFAAFKCYINMYALVDDIPIGDIPVIEVAASVKIKMVRETAAQMGIVFAVAALSVVMTFEGFMTHVKPPLTEPAPSTTSAKWWYHFHTLIESGILRRVARRAIRFYSKYFAVPKNAEEARAIFNGRAFSVECATPPPVNLPDFAEVLSLLKVIFKNERLYCSFGDFRHWFHQIPVHRRISNFFGLRIPNEDQTRRGHVYYRWTTLPMGWAWSPYIAQTISWILIMETLQQCGEDISEYCKSTSLPPYIVIERDGKPIAVLTCWYDNVGIFTTDGNLNSKFYKRFDAVCRNHHAVLKNWDTFDCLDSLPKALSHPNYLHTEFAVNITRTRGEKPQSSLMWRHDSDRIKKWTEFMTKIRDQSELTPRQLSKVVGILTWHHHLTLEPMCLIEEVIEGARLAGEEAAKIGWDGVSESATQCVTKLLPRLPVVLANEWINKSQVACTSDLYAASDSSGPKWCYLVWRGLTLVKNEHKSWTGSALLAHIFVKELLAAVMCIEYICTWCEPQTMIHIAIDNTAACHVLRRLYSSTKVGLELANRVLKALRSKEAGLDVVSIKSEENPSDAPTRNREVSSDQTENLFRIFEASKRGLHRQQSSRPFKRSGDATFSRVRHAESSEADERRYDSDVDSDEDREDHDITCAEWMELNVEW